MQGKKKVNCVEELIHSLINLSENSIYTYVNSFRVLIFQDNLCKHWSLLIAPLPLMFGFLIIFQFHLFMLHRAHFLFLPLPFCFELSWFLRRWRINCLLLVMIQVWKNCWLATANFLLGESTAASLVKDKVLAKGIGNLGWEPHGTEVIRTMVIHFSRQTSNSRSDYFSYA